MAFQRRGPEGREDRLTGFLLLPPIYFLLMRVPAQYVSVTERHAERKPEHKTRGFNFTVPYLEIDASSEAELETVNCGGVPRFNG